MSVVIDDNGFCADHWTHGFCRVDDLPARESTGPLAVDIDNDFDVSALRERFGGIALIRVAFPTATDGRGYSQARHLRMLGYRGRLRAAGHLIADQYVLARQSGFDEVEISDSLAARQPEAQWRNCASRARHSYQTLLRT